MPPLDGYSFREFFQVLLREISGDGYSNKNSKGHLPQCCGQQDETKMTKFCPQYFPDSNFLYSFSRLISDDAEQSKTGNSYCKRCEESNLVAGNFFILIKSADLLIQKIPIENIAREQRAIKLFYFLDRRLEIDPASIFNDTFRGAIPLGIR